MSNQTFDKFNLDLDGLDNYYGDDQATRVLVSRDNYSVLVLNYEYAMTNDDLIRLSYIAKSHPILVGTYANANEATQATDAHYQRECERLQHIANSKTFS